MIMRKYIITCALIASVTVLSSCMDGGKGKPQETPAIDSISDTLKNSDVDVPKSDKLTKEDQTFAFAAATGGAMEIESGQLAISKSKNADVKAFATQMVKDHSAASAELKVIANKLGLKLPDTLTSEHQTHLMNLKTLNDLAFDKQYMTMMIADHAKTVRLFDDGTHIPDTDLKAYAAKTIPVIRQHRVRALEIAKKLNLKNVNTGDDLGGESPAAAHTN
jgi:putative membrane protein